MSTDDESDGTLVMGQAPTERLLSAELIVLNGPAQGRRYAVGPAPFRLGSAPSCAIRLEDPAVSRIHCELTPERSSLRVVDAGSTNGTFVGEVRVRDADLPAGATLRVGQTSLRLEAAPAPLFVELSTRDRFGDVIGKSPGMRRLYAMMERVAATDATVLIQGETGSGKELVGHALHEASGRASGPFVAVDCGALAETLIESELFGHVRGAFSGAVATRIGLFEVADGGTLFLDEIGELPLSLQPKLLRVLETREVRPLGGNTTKKVDVRVIAATHQALARNVNEGTFREDLYYRLAVVELRLPPLSARLEDIPLLARHFYQRFTGRSEGVPRELLAALVARSWPGNVRELRNFIERWVALGEWAPAATDADAVPITPELGLLLRADLPLKEARSAWTGAFERLYVRALLEHTDGNVTRAAEVAGVNRRWFQRLMVQVGARDNPDEAS